MCCCLLVYRLETSISFYITKKNPRKNRFKAKIFADEISEWCCCSAVLHCCSFVVVCCLLLLFLLYLIIFHFILFFYIKKEML